MKFVLAASILFTPALSFGIVKPLSFNRPSLISLNGRNFDFDGDDVGRQFGKSIDKGWENDSFLDNLNGDGSDRGTTSNQDSPSSPSQPNAPPSGGGSSGRFANMMAAASDRQYNQDRPTSLAGIKNTKLGDKMNSINSTSDLYLEQLKADTAVRKKALWEGDMDKFNTVFEHDEVKVLKEMDESNPFSRDRARTAAVEGEGDADALYKEIRELQELNDMKEGSYKKAEAGKSYQQQLREKMEAGRGTKATTTDVNAQQGVGIREEPTATTTPPAEQGMRLEKDGKGGRYSQIKTMLSSVKGEGKYGLKEDVGMEEKGKLREGLIELREDIMDEVV
ncbi:hypothetical protein TrCOL_g7146 [Triparma columacea]|uniref:Uncharacterized protein n=1 Tax=Triparma columacea TaxID=722753 RepID=A0A9W7LDH8_9STRA|nr:hypothetical protein TrCOL_g7146 [Triparma columacea]